MSTLALIMATTNNERSNSSRTINAFASFLYVGGTALAIYLALRDGAQQVRTATKVWVFLLALLEPWFFIILHGISCSLTGTQFFASTPLVGTGGTPLDMTPSAVQGAGSLLGSTPGSPLVPSGLFSETASSAY